MNINKLIYYILQFTLIDEILGFLYWALAIYGIYLIVGFINSPIILIGALCIYIASIVFIYITLLKKVKYFFKANTK